jgi:hypothetical protein
VRRADRFGRRGTATATDDFAHALAVQQIRSGQGASRQQREYLRIGRCGS